MHVSQYGAEQNALFFACRKTFYTSLTCISNISNKRNELDFKNSDFFSLLTDIDLCSTGLTTRHGNSVQFSSTSWSNVSSSTVSIKKQKAAGTRSARMAIALDFCFPSCQTCLWYISTKCFLVTCFSATFFFQ